MLRACLAEGTVTVRNLHQ